MILTTGKFENLILEISDQIGTIKLNRPKTLNAIDNDFMIEIISALRILDENTDTIITVLTGVGRFFSAGADIRTNSLYTRHDNDDDNNDDNDSKDLRQQHVDRVKKKISFMSYFATHIEILRTVIDHRKVFVLALNGPAVGGGAAWFTGVADIVVASTDCYLQAPFSALGLVPELGSAPIISQSFGVHRTNEFLMFGQPLNAGELEASGLVNRLFPADHFQACVTNYLTAILKSNNGRSLLEAKRLMNRPMREGRLAAVMESVDALAERFVDGTPRVLFENKVRELEAKSKVRSSKL